MKFSDSDVFAALSLVASHPETPGLWHQKIHSDEPAVDGRDTRGFVCASQSVIAPGVDPPAVDMAQAHTVESLAAAKMLGFGSSYFYLLAQGYLGTYDLRIRQVGVLLFCFCFSLVLLWWGRS